MRSRPYRRLSPGKCDSCPARPVSAPAQCGAVGSYALFLLLALIVTAAGATQAFRVCQRSA